MICFILLQIAAWRRYQAVGWLDSIVGPLGLSSQPSEREFISCLRNGQILCSVINKVHPGAVPKVSISDVKILSPSLDLFFPLSELMTIKAQRINHGAQFNASPFVM